MKLKQALPNPVMKSFDVFFDVNWTSCWTNNPVVSELRCHYSLHYIVILHEYFMMVDTDLIPAIPYNEHIKYER